MQNLTATLALVAAGGAALLLGTVVQRWSGERGQEGLVSLLNAHLPPS